MNRTFAAALAAAMEREHVTNEQLGEAVGVSGQMVSLWRNAKSRIDPATVFVMEQQLRCVPGALSKHLGYYPPDALPDLSVEAAIDRDRRLSDSNKIALSTMYRSLAGRS